MLFQTTNAHEELRAKVRAYAEEEIKPIAFLLDQQNEFPEEAIRKLGKMGLMGIPYPKEYGGAGLDVLSYAIAVEELSRIDGGTGVILSAHVSLGSWPIFAYGTEEQKKKKTDAAKLPPNSPARFSRTQPSGIFIILKIVCIYAPSIRTAQGGNGYIFCSAPRALFGHRIITAPAERITAQNAPDTQSRTHNNAPLLYCLNRVRGTGGCKSAAGNFARRNVFLIKSNQPYQKSAHSQSHRL